MSHTKAIEDFRREREWLFTLLTDPKGERFFIEKSRETLQQQFQDGLARMAAFLEFAGNPHSKFPSVHIAGTSGKGSVTTMVAALLTACGQRTADHTSPYLQLALEKLRVDGQMIAPSAFAELVREFRKLYEQWQMQGKTLKYGEAWVFLTFLWFAQQRLDWGVIETGMGGRYDPTNVLSAELAIITNVDLDHTKSLGDTIPEIAWHKVGIIKPHQRVVTAATRPETLAAISAEANQKNATVQHVTLTDDLIVMARYGSYSIANLPLKGHFQRINAATAITAVDWLAHDFGFTFNEQTIHASRITHHSTGRFEIVQENPTIILDGAHNPHKIAALVDSIQRDYRDKKFWVLAGMIVGKSAEPILRSLLPITKHLILSQPNVIGKPAQSAESLWEMVSQICQSVSSSA